MVGESRAGSEHTLSRFSRPWSTFRRCIVWVNLRTARVDNAAVAQRVIHPERESKTDLRMRKNTDGGVGWLSFLPLLSSLLGLGRRTKSVFSLSLLSSIPVRVWVYFTELPLLLKYSFRRCIVWGNVRTSILLSCLAPCCRLVIVIPKLTRLNVVREKII